MNFKNHLVTFVLLLSIGIVVAVIGAGLIGIEFDLRRGEQKLALFIGFFVGLIPGLFFAKFGAAFCPSCSTNNAILKGKQFLSSDKGLFHYHCKSCGADYRF